MSFYAKAAGTLAAFAVLGAWSWHHGRYDGQTFVVITALLVAASVLILRDIDSQRFARLTDPRPLPHEDRK